MAELDPELAITLALLHLSPQLPFLPPHRAEPLLRVGVDGGSALAAHLLGRFCLADAGRQPEGVELLRLASERGDLDAEHLLALALFHGIGAPSDLDAARSHQRQAAEQGHADAALELSLMLAGGLGGPASADEAEYWLQMAASRGSAGALLNLGGRFARSEGAARDLEQAIDCYQRAAHAGSAEAAARLAVMFTSGSEVPKDLEQGERWFERFKLIQGRSKSPFALNAAEVGGRAADRLRSDPDGAAAVGKAVAPPPPDRTTSAAEIPDVLATSRKLLGQLLDNDASEVFSKLHAMIDAAPELGEPLILEMAARNMDLRGVVVALRDRIDRELVKSWLQAAVTDELQLLVYMAMI